VAEECGVRYVLEGSLQRSDNRLRIISQLCDAIKGHHLWSERYDREVKDIFAVQDELTMRILSAVHVKLTEADKTRLFEEVTDNLAAWEKCADALMTPNPADWRPLLKEAIELDPKFITPYVWMGFSYMFDVWLCSTKSPAQDIEKAIQWAQKALTVNDSTAGPHYLLGKILNTKQQHEMAIPLAERAIELNPNSTDAIFFVAQIYAFSGRPEEALDWNEKLYRINPFPDPTWYVGLGTILNIVGRYDDSIRAFEKVLGMDHVLYQRQFADIELAKSYALLGREKEARKAAAEILTHAPMATAEYLVKSWGYMHREDEERFIEALHRAGLPLEAPENMRFWEEF
jgi:adenylate cyclase